MFRVTTVNGNTYIHRSHKTIVEFGIMIKEADTITCDAGNVLITDHIVSFKKIEDNYGFEFDLGCNPNGFNPVGFMERRIRRDYSH